MVCERGEASSSIYSHGNVGSREYFTRSRMQPSWRRHQETSRRRRTRLAHAGVQAHPGCGRTQVYPPHDLLPYGSCMLGLGCVFVDFGPCLIWWGMLHGPFSSLCLHRMEYALFVCAFLLHFHVFRLFFPTRDKSPKLCGIC